MKKLSDKDHNCFKTPGEPLKELPSIQVTALQQVIRDEFRYPMLLHAPHAGGTDQILLSPSLNTLTEQDFILKLC